MSRRQCREVPGLLLLFRIRFGRFTSLNVSNVVMGTTHSSPSLAGTRVWKETHFLRSVLLLLRSSFLRLLLLAPFTEPCKVEHGEVEQHEQLHCNDDQQAVQPVKCEELRICCERKSTHLITCVLKLPLTTSM